MASKGKAVAGDSSSGGKRKRDKNSGGSGGGSQKRKNRDVLQFFEDSAAEDDVADSSDFSDGFDDLDDFIDDFDSEPNIKSEPGLSEPTPIFPKEEELSGEELEKALEERYKSGSKYVRLAEDEFVSKRSVDRSSRIPSVGETAIWKVKCKVGRERHTFFCLLQKYADLKALGTNLQIISAFSVEHIKGFVFIEAEKISDVTEACNQLADVYFSLVTKVPANEVSQLLTVRRRHIEVKVGSWARVKNGIYRGDIAQVVAVNNERKRATVKLIPRVDLQALAAKFGAGAALKKPTKGSAPAARLISSRDLEEFRPLMQFRRDRDTGKVFEFLDSLMLKDGFLFKKVSFDSLSFWDVNPSEEELQKFSIPMNDESDNSEWLSQLYGEQKKNCSVNVSKGGGKGEGSSGSNEQSSFEVHDLVLFGKRDFGMVVGMEKDENYKILKYGSDGPVMMTLGQKDLKYLPLEKKFTALDHCLKTISINEEVRIVDGPTKGREGIVKHIYRGIIFLYDENDLDNAYFCARSQASEKLKHSDSACHRKDEGGPSGFEDVPTSPKSPLSPKKPWQNREYDSDERKDRDGMFSVGQSLRIRVGPLKGYLCRVLAIRFSDITVKLDSQQKVLTVKREHLSEVRGKSSATSLSDNGGLSSPFKPFDLLGGEGCSNDWLQGTCQSGDGDGWNVSGSAERSTWPSNSSSGAAAGISTTALPGSADNDSGKDDDGWGSKVSSNHNSSWGAAKKDKAVGGSDWGGAWDTSNDGREKSSVAPACGSWETLRSPGGDHEGSWKVGGSCPDQVKEGIGGEADPWDMRKKAVEKTSNWCKVVASESGDKDNSGWGQSTDGLKKDAVMNVNGSWADAKVSEEGPSDDIWEKVAGRWGNTDNSSDSKWRSSADTPGGDGKGWAKGRGAWENSQEKNNVGGLKDSDRWKKSGNSAQGNMDSWIKADGNDSWGQSKTSNNDRGLNGGRGYGGRKGGHGHDQFGRGRGRSFDRNKLSSSKGDQDQGSEWGNKGWSHGQSESSWERSWDNGKTWNNNVGGNNNGLSQGQGKSSWGTTSAGGDGQGGSWDKGKSWSNNEGDDKKGSSQGLGGSSWGKISGVGDGPRGSWGNGKDWNNNQDADNSGWNKSADAGNCFSMSSEKKSSAAGWNAGFSGPSSWGQKSWEKGKGTAGGDSSFSKASQDDVAAMDVDDGGGNKGGGWNSGAGGGWRSGGDNIYRKSWNTESSDMDGGGSWSKSAGNDQTWGRPINFDNDRGFGRGRGSGGRRGRGVFRGGRDQSGRDGGRFSDRVQFSSWKNEGGGGSPWVNSSGGNNGGSSWSQQGWSKSNEGGSSWGAQSKNENASQDGSSWGNYTWNKTDSTSNGGGSSWGKPSENRSENRDQGGSSWGKSSEKKNENGAGQDASSWGNNTSWNKSQNAAQGCSSWGNSTKKENENAAGQGASSCGNTSWNKNENAGQADSSWGNSFGKKSERTGQGESSWGNSSCDKTGNTDGCGPTWGSSSANEAGNTGAGGLSWGNSSQKATGQGGASWGS